MISWPPQITLPLSLAARITRTLSWKFKNFTMRTLGMVDRLGCVRPGNLCALSMRGGLGNVAGPSASGSHFSRKATASFPSNLSGTLTSRRLDRRERFSSSSSLFVRRVTCLVSASVLPFSELTVSFTLLMRPSASIAYL